jgi:pimeloyl-ACP methyl ester carboxylesterase
MQKAPQPFGARVYALTGADTRGWPYIAHVPDEYRGDEPMPLLIHLSGGSGGAYASMLTSRDAMAETGWLMVFPQARGMWWHAGTTAMMETLLATLGRRFNVDWNRVYLAGFSNGASGAFYYATLWPHRFAAVVSMMGAGAHVPGIYRAPAEHAVTVPMLILHGDRDDVVPLKAARATVAALKRVDRDAPVRLRVLRGRGHDVVLDRCDGLALSFLARHVRDPFPRHVRLRLRDLRHPRRFWIEMLAKDGKLAEVEAEVGAANVVRLRCRNVRRLRLLARRELFHDAGPVRVLIGKRKVFEEYLSRIDEHHETFRPTGDPYLDSYSPIEIDLGE